MKPARHRSEAAKKLVFQTCAQFAVCVIFIGATGYSQNITLKDGKVIPGKNLRRDGATIMTTVPTGNSLGEIGYAVAQIASIEFPEPSQLKEASNLAVAGKLEPALAAIEPVIASQRPFKEIKGNFWGSAALLKLQLLIALGREKEADPLAREMIGCRENPDAVAAATAAQALLSAKQGNAKLALANSALIISQDGADPAILAIAYVAKGHAHLLLKEYKDAIFAYLHLPTFLPEQKPMMPPALLGCLRCFAKIQSNRESDAELDRAMKTLLETYPDSPEASMAKSEFPNVVSRIQKSKS